jgi:hypothetical protein
MHAPVFNNAVITLAIIALYVMAMRSHRRALRAEAALFRVEAIITKGIIQPVGDR